MSKDDIMLVLLLFLCPGSLSLINFPDGSDGKEPACIVGYWVRSLGQEDALEKRMATHSSILAWRIPWTEEPSELRSIRVAKS